MGFSVFLDEAEAYVTQCLSNFWSSARPLHRGDVSVGEKNVFLFTV